MDAPHKGATLLVKNQNSSRFRNETYASAGGLTSLPLRSQREAWALYNSSKRPHVMSSALTLQPELSAHLEEPPHTGWGPLDLVVLRLGMNHL